MVAMAARHSVGVLHPLHAMLLAFVFPSFLGALLSDWAYWSSYHIQWINFAQWLIVGGLIGGGFALLWAALAAFRGRHGRRGGALVYPVTLLVMWLLAFINILVHSKDAWASMPAGLWLSVIVTILAAIASWIGFAGPRAGDVK